MYRPYHLIGLETPVSVLEAGLNGAPTGGPRSFSADVVATAKRDLAAGETLDGEGGAMVWGRLADATRSVAARSLPMGLARGLRVRNAVAAGSIVRYDDVEPPPASTALEARRELERSITLPARRAGSRRPRR